MRTFLILVFGLLFAGVFSDSGMSQTTGANVAAVDRIGHGLEKAPAKKKLASPPPCLCGIGCKVVGDKDLPGPNEIYVQCASTNCVPGCDGQGVCTEFRFWNEYTCGITITKVTFNSTEETGASFNICSAEEYANACAWTINYHDAQYIPPCWYATYSSENWEVDAPDGCGAGQGDAVIIDYCGPSCNKEKITWTVTFSDGCTCTFSLADLNNGGPCCGG